MIKKILKMFLSVLFAVLLVAGLLPVTAAKAEEELKNVSISPEGILSWDAFPGAENYMLEIGSGGGYADGTSVNLNANCENYGFASGTYEVRLYAIDANNAQISAKWTGSFTYTSAKPQLATPSNVQWTGGTVSWDPVPNAEEYLVIIDNRSVYTENCSVDVSGKVPEGNHEYTYSIMASAQGYPDSEPFKGKIELNINRAGLTNVSISPEGIITWDAFPGATQYFFELGTGGGNISLTTENLYNCCEAYGFESGTYNLRIFAKDDQDNYLSAVWTGTYTYTKGSFYVVTFYENGGSNIMPGINVPAGADFTLPENGFGAPDGMEFDGWEIPGYGTFSPGTPFQPGSNMTVNAVWKEKPGDPSEYKAKLENIDCGEATVGYTETTNYIFRVDIIGAYNLNCDDEHYKIEFSGDTDAFSLWASIGGTYMVNNMYNAGSVQPNTGLPEGEYKATASLYYDIDGTGTAFDWMLLDTAEFTFKVLPDKAQFDICVSVYDISLNQKWSGGQVYLLTDGEKTNGFQDSGYGFYATEGTIVTIKAAAKDGYEFVEWRLNGANGAEFSKEAEYDFYANENLDLYAIFKKIETEPENSPTPGEGDNKPTSGETTEKTPTPKGSSHHKTDDYDDSDEGNGLLIFLIIAGSVVVVAGVVIAVVLAKKKKK